MLDRLSKVFMTCVTSSLDILFLHPGEVSTGVNEKIMNIVACPSIPLGIGIISDA